MSELEPKVQLLDANTANQIAAGEVVEKPASVVKELVENALDAGADKIDVTIFAGGTEYIRVADNGCGMNEENARLAVLRHATSKLRAAEDLQSLHTLGFRGEALPSIASVSNFTLLTRHESEEFAVSVHIDGGENTEVSQTGGNAGTTVVVENLFFNVPARRKFLKTVSTEGRYINELLTKLALSRPDVRFKLLSNDKEVLNTPGDGNLEGAIRALYGKNVASELLRVEFADPSIKISGFIGKPTLLKGTRQWQTLFVNGRMITNKMLAKAIDHAYQSQIPKSGFPFAVLNIQVDTHTIDVNVHPQKSEIKFSDDSTIYKAMYKALTDALTRPMKAEQLTGLLPDSELQGFVKSGSSSTSSFGSAAGSGSVAGAAAVKPANKPGFNPPVFKSGMGSIFKTPESETAAANGREGGILSQPETVGATGVVGSSASGKGTFAGSHGYGSAVPKAEQQAMWEPFSDFQQAEAGYAEPQQPVFSINEVREQFAKSEPLNASDTVSVGNGLADNMGVMDTALPATNAAQAAAAPKENISFTNADSGIATIWPIGQVDKTFIIAQSEDTLYLIDQHAAHERILYDKLVAAHENIPAQQLLMPLYIDMAEDEIAAIEEHHDEFLRLGVDVSSAGEAMLRISSLPTDIKAEDAEDFIREISKMLRELRSINASDLRQEVLHMTACKAAIKAGQLLNMRQMRQLIIDLCNTTHPFTCPHGRPCMIEFDSDKLYKMFKRTGF